VIWTIVKREFLDNILSFKFIACVLVAVVISLASTAILTRDYQDRLRNYDKGVAAAREALTKVPVYSSLKVRLFRKPSPLSVFVAGIERKAGDYAEISVTYMDIPASLQGGTAKNEFAAAFAIFDFSSVIIIIFTVLAILLSYGSISGEKEDGMLSLALSNSVPRAKVLLGKYLGALASIAVPLALCFILGLLLVAVLKAASLDASFLTFMGLLYSVALLYLSCVLLLGIFASSRTKTSFGSLLFLLTFYLIFTFLIPQAVKSFSSNVIRSQTKNLETNIQALIDKRYQGSGSASQKTAFKKTWVIPRDGDSMMLYGGIILKRITSPEYIENQNLVTAYQVRVERDYAQKVYDLKTQDMAAEERIRLVQDRVLAFVPSVSFGRIAELMADTGDESLRRCLRQVSLYWHQLMDYLDRKGALGTRFCYPGPDELTAYEKDLIKKITEDRAGWTQMKGTPWAFFYRGKYYAEAMAYKPPLTFLELGDLPVLKASELEFATKLRSSLFNIAILGFYNILFFVLAYFSFASYDPRRID
jgi:ABC-type transport system involved in multi-copper enzyme maturation permease subunit